MTNREYDLSKNEQRLVIPFFDKDKQLITFQGRAFINTQLRYITIKMDEESSKIFGLERLDIKQKFYIVEGPFDSMFLPNCIAMAGSDISFRGNDDIKDAMDDHKGTIIFDNEPRNKEIIDRMEKVIDKGWNICIWPDSADCKDINDMILSGIIQTRIIEIINKNLTLIEKIKKFIIINDEFTIDNGMLTPTLKLKRKKVLENYKQQLENLY